MRGLHTVASLLADATRRLADALQLEPREARIEARVLISHALKVDHAWLIGHDRDTPTPAQQDAIENLIARRAAGEPVAYILGEREFYGRTFKVTPDVLIPRPETELLVEAALARLSTGSPASVLDLGTGSGCIAITLALECPLCAVTSVDISALALCIAEENAHRLAASPHFLQSDLYQAIGDLRFDLILSNPPYIAQRDPHLQQGDVRFEPALALVSGQDGLDALRGLIQDAPKHLVAGGWLILEHGWDQADSLRELMAQFGLTHVECLPDLAGHGRITLGQWIPQQ
jgi:release factor glutamine methyltransferase